MYEFDVDGHDYRASRMPARTQFHVLRRMAPIISPLQTLTTNGGGPAALIALAEAISSLSDEASDYIIDQCLAVVQRKQGESGWANVKPPNASTIMFQDIDMMAMLQIAANVLRDNYTALFQKGLAGLSGGASPSA